MFHPLTPLTQENNAFNQVEKEFYEKKFIMQFLSYGSLVSKTFEWRCFYFKTKLDLEYYSNKSQRLYIIS